MSREFSSDEFIRRFQWSCHGWHEKHELLGETYWDGGRGARWCIGRPNDFTFRSEIIAGIGGSLVVHGDFDTVRFAHYGDHGDAWSRLLWMADCRDLGYYVLQKASIGMRHEYAHDFDSDVAKYDLKGILAEHVEDEPGEGRRHAALGELLTGALGHTDSKQELWDWLYAQDEFNEFHWLTECSIGDVPSHSVITGHVALNKLASLLREKYGDAGPPECRAAEAHVAA